MPPRKKASTPSQVSLETSPTSLGSGEQMPTGSTTSGGIGKELAEVELPASLPSRQQALPQDEFMTVIVTPKLSFQLCKRPEWKTVEDISQDDLRRGFLSRFPPALWMSSEKFAFKPALPPSSQITEDTRSLVFKLVSEEVSDERVMLGILRELEKSYEAIIRRAVTETRSEALNEQLSLQEQAEAARREQEKQVKDLRKDNKGLRDQLQSMQKRLFLLEQEKDQLRKEMQQMQERTCQLEKARKSERAEQVELREQFELLRRSVEALASRGEETATEATQAESERPKARKTQKRTVQDGHSSGKASVGSQTDLLEDSQDAVHILSQKVEQLQQQFGGLQGWLAQGSLLLAASSVGSVSGKAA